MKKDNKLLVKYLIFVMVFTVTKYIYPFFSDSGHWVIKGIQGIFLLWFLAHFLSKNRAKDTFRYNRLKQKLAYNLYVIIEYSFYVIFFFRMSYSWFWPTTPVILDYIYFFFLGVFVSRILLSIGRDYLMKYGIPKEE